MRHKAVNTYPSLNEYIPDCYKTQEMCDEVVNRCFFEFDSIPDRYKTQEMCDRVGSVDPFFDSNCPDIYKTQRMYDEVVDNYLATLKFIPDWFVTSKMIKKILTTLYTDDNILYFNEDSGNAVFSCNDMGVLNIDLNDNLDDVDYNEDDHKTITHIKILAWYIKFEKRKAFRKDLNEELMLLA